ncbi:MAG: glutamate ligase domain-containing protein [Faecalibacterium prausnitzii]
MLDGSHNAHGMRATVQSLKDRFPGQKFVFLVSIMADKDVDEMLALLAPLAERFVTVTAHNPRHAGADAGGAYPRLRLHRQKLRTASKPVWRVRKNWAAKARYAHWARCISPAMSGRPLPK